MGGKFSEMFATSKIVLEGHVYEVRRPGTADGIAWFKGIPALTKRDPGMSLAESLPDPSSVAEGIEKYLASVDGEPYDPKENPAASIPFAVALPLYNYIFRLAVPEAEAKVARGIL